MAKPSKDKAFVKLDPGVSSGASKIPATPASNNTDTSQKDINNINNLFTSVLNKIHEVFDYVNDEKKNAIYNKVERIKKSPLTSFDEFISYLRDNFPGYADDPDCFVYQMLDLFSTVNNENDYHNILFFIIKKDINGLSEYCEGKPLTFSILSDFLYTKKQYYVEKIAKILKRIKMLNNDESKALLDFIKDRNNSTDIYPSTFYYLKPVIKTYNINRQTDDEFKNFLKVDEEVKRQITGLLNNNLYNINSLKTELQTTDIMLEYVDKLTTYYNFNDFIFYPKNDNSFLNDINILYASETEDLNVETAFERLPVKTLEKLCKDVAEKIYNSATIDELKDIEIITNTLENNYIFKYIKNTATNKVACEINKDYTYNDILCLIFQLGLYKQITNQALSTEVIGDLNKFITNNEKIKLYVKTLYANLERLKKFVEYQGGE